jgi:sigma-B regulation protein RsbU (phosphoserine phosphatase)
MPRIALRHLIGPKKDAAPLVTAFAQALGTPIRIEDAEGRLLADAAVSEGGERYPVALNGHTLGWVSGGPRAEAVAALLAHLAGKEAERKTLGSEVLHLYREVNLIYSFSEKLAALLEVKAVAKLTLEQARQMIAATDGAVMLLDDETRVFEPVAGFGGGLPCSGPFRWGQGLIGSIAAGGNAEIVNDVRADPRCQNERVGSLLCAPLKVNERVMGLIVVASADPVNYAAGDLKLLNTLALQSATAIENARLFERTVQAARDRERLLALHKELEVASAIQKSILPSTFPPFPERSEFEIHAAMTPATEVGGDFFDFFLIDEGRLGFVIADVSGKGVPAALFMAVSRTLIKATALRGLPPEECLSEVNRVLALENASSMFVTVFYGVLDLHGGEVTYCCAGHNPPYVLRADGRVEVLERTGGMALGVLDTVTYSSKRLRLEKGDGLFLYTDGITEAMDGDHNEFTDRRLEQCLRQVPRKSLVELIDGVVAEVTSFVNGAPQADDMTTLALRYLA